MRFSCLAVLAFALSTHLGACTSESRPALSPAQTATAPVAASEADLAPTTHVVPAPPSGPIVIDAIFQNPGDHSSSYEVDNGSWATYWFGYRYDVDGVPHFTGFVEQSPDRMGGDANVDHAPAAKATLTQATFKAPDMQTGWAFLGAQRSVGEVGARGRADAVDPARKPLAHRVGAGRLVVAVPTNASIEQGTVQKNYEVLLRTTDGMWSHAGTLQAGHDDSAGCDEGRAFTCTPIVGRLAYVGESGLMPLIRITLVPSDSTSSTPEVVTYRFDARTTTYQPTAKD